jgi:hypothetical protein
MAHNIRVFKANGCPELDKKTLELMVRYLKYAIVELGLEEKPIKIRLLGKAPNEPITTGAYAPHDKTISAICDGRHFVDYMRTIAHELTHMKQDYAGDIAKPHPEIGGPIEDEANVMSGRITKYFIKNMLNKEEREHLGLGTYGMQNEVRKLIREAIDEVLSEHNNSN